MLINYLANIDDVACKALIDIQPNVQVVTFDSRGKGAIGEKSIINRSIALKIVEFCTKCHLLHAPIDQSRYHDDDLISLLSVEDQRESVFSLQGVRLSSEFFLKVLKVRRS